VLDSRNFIKRQLKTFQKSPFACLYELHFVQTFETSGHQFSSKSSIGISKERSTSKRRSRFSFSVKSAVNITTEEVAAGKEESKVVVFSFIKGGFFVKKQYNYGRKGSRLRRKGSRLRRRGVGKK